MRVVFFDLETGGTEPTKHPIIQIAAIAVDEQLNELAQFEAKLKFDMAYADPQALAMNSYEAEAWASNAITPAKACMAFSRFIEPYCDVNLVSQRTGRPYSVAKLAGHNAASFDGPFIQTLYKQQGMFLAADFRILDTLQRAMWHFHEHRYLRQPEDLKLGTLAKHFEIETPNSHDALGDVRTTIAIYRALSQSK